MPMIRNRTSSTNEGEEDTFDKQSRLSVEAEQRQVEVEERYRQAEEHHLEAMKVVEQREDELHLQIAMMKAASERLKGTTREAVNEIDGTPIPPNFREVVVEPFDETQDPHVHLQAFQT
ncbi:hypothetical protein CR513_51688, partial [Mucuna pruriens]